MTGYSKSALTGLWCLIAAPSAMAEAMPASVAIAQNMDANGPWLRRPDGSLYKPPIYRGETAPPVKKHRRGQKRPRPRRG